MQTQTQSKPRAPRAPVAAAVVSPVAAPVVVEAVPAAKSANLPGWLPAEVTIVNGRFADLTSVRVGVLAALNAADASMASAGFARMQAVAQACAMLPPDDVREAFSAKSAGLPEVKARTPEQKTLASRLSECGRIVKCYRQMPADDWARLISRTGDPADDDSNRPTLGWQPRLAVVRDFCEMLAERNSAEREAQRLRDVAERTTTTPEAAQAEFERLSAKAAEAEAVKAEAEAAPVVAGQTAGAGLAKRILRSQSHVDSVAYLRGLIHSLTLAHEQACEAEAAAIRKEAAAKQAAK